MTTLSWTSTGTTEVQVRVGSPTGALFAHTGPSGSWTTGDWVVEPTVFYLQDVSNGLPLTAENTLATVTVHLTTAGCAPRITPTAVVASNSTADSPPCHAVDGNLSTLWNSGNFPPQWIRLDLGQAHSVSQLRLLVNQYPAGQTTHEIYGGLDPLNLTLLRTLNGYTQSQQWLDVSFSPVATNVRYLEVRTTASPSWVAWSEIEVYGTSSGPTVPTAPTNLTATAASSSQVNLNWQDNSANETGFKVERQTGAGGVWGVVATPGQNATSYQNTGLAAATTYYYRVRATNTAGDSAASNEISVTTPGGGGTQTIFNESCGTVQPGNVSIGCDPNNEVPGTMFDRSFTVSYAAGDTVQVRLFNIDDHEHVYVNGVQRGQANYAQDVTVDLTPYMVAGSNTVRLTLVNDNYTPWCYGFTLTKTSGGASPPAAPTGLTAAAGNAPVALSWTASSEATSYNVKRATVSGGPYSVIAAGVTATTYTNTGLTNGTTYYYVVSASNAAGESANSNQASATPTAGLPSPPTNLAATAGDAQVALTWSGSTGATSYNVKRAATSGGPYSVIAAGVTATTYTDTGLTNGTTYYYVVSASNAAGESPNSNPASATPAGAAAAGAPVSLFSGDGTYRYQEGTGVAARWRSPRGGAVAKDPVSGYHSLFIADTDNCRIRMIYLEGPNAGQSILIAGNGTAGYWEGGGDPYQAWYNYPNSVSAVTDASGVATELLIADTENHMIRKLPRPLSGSAWRPAWFSGQGLAGYADGTAAASRYYYPRAAVLAPDGYIYVTDSGNGRIRRLDAQGNSATLASGLSDPIGIAARPSGGVLYVTDGGTHNILQVSTGGTVTTLAGGGVSGFADGTGTAARFFNPNHLVWANPAGGEALYIADISNHRIRKLVIATTEVTTWAGFGTQGYLEGTCAAARFNKPRGIARGPAGELYVMDTNNNRIRKVQ